MCHCARSAPIWDWTGRPAAAHHARYVLADELRSVVITTTNPQGGDPEVLCLPLDLLPGWLFGISATRVKPDLREKITRYRRECFRVLWDAFKYEIIAREIEEEGSP